jgi:transcription elongation factor Elf1
MNELLERSISCPYCGESIEVLIDASEPQQSYIEDCQVCCRPINFNVNVSLEGDAVVIVSHEDE